MKTDAELRDIALDIEGGSIFTDRHLRPNEHDRMLRSIFMPLALMDEERLDKFVKSEPGLIRIQSRGWPVGRQRLSGLHVHEDPDG